jgi:hypothetical protein
MLTSVPPAAARNARRESFFRSSMAALLFSGCRVDLIVTLDEGRFQPKATVLLAVSVFHYRIFGPTKDYECNCGRRDSR